MAYTKTNWVNGTTPLNDKNMNKIENALENLDTNISKSTDEYSSTRTYSIGELVIYNNKLYKANQDITTAEAFNSSHWTEVTLLSDINEIKSVVNNNADNLNKMEEGIANAVEKTGDTLTGELNFNNKSDYGAIKKTRTLNGTDYQLTVGIGGNGSARMEFVKVPDNVLSSVEARSDGVYNGASGKKLVETNEVNFVHLHTNSTTFSFSIGTSSGGYCTYIIYGGWSNHFMYLLTVHPNPENDVIGYNQIFNNTEANITNVTISNNVVTINFSSTIWGGLHIIGEQAQST